MEGPGPPKTLKNHWFFKAFGVVGFQYFGDLDGPPWGYLSSCWPDLAPKWLPKWVPTWLQVVPEWAILALKKYRLSLPELAEKLLLPRWLQDGSRWPQVAQDSLLGAFLGLYMLSWKALAAIPGT